MSFCHAQFVVCDLQRVWLHLWAMLDYMEIFKPRMDGLAPPSQGVHDTVGCYTNSIWVAQDMYTAGLPSWLIRSSASSTNQKIVSMGDIFHPEDYLILELHPFKYLVIFKWPATSLEKYQKREYFSHNFLCSRDAFSLPSSPVSASTTLLSSGTAQPSMLLLLSSFTVASTSATRQLTGQDSRSHKPARGHIAGNSLVFFIVECY